MLLLQTHPFPRTSQALPARASGPVMPRDGAVRRPEVTQRVYLCAPAAFRARRLGGGGQKILIARPCEWARQRRIAQRRQHAGDVTMGWATLPSWQARYSFDVPTALPIIKQYVQSYRLPIIGGLGAAASAAAAIICVHAWHAQPRVQPSFAQAAKVPAPTRMVSALARPVAFAGVIGSAVSTSVPRKVASVQKPAARAALGLTDDGAITVVAQPRSAHAEGFNLDITSPASLWAKAGARYRIDPVLIYAIALVETRGTQSDGSVAPSPWVVRINGRVHSGSRAETEHAIEMAHLLVVPVQDVGIMQVYYPVHRDIEPDPIALLNPARNIEIGTRLLRQAMNRSGDPVLRIGYYHSHDATLARGYGQLVLSVYKELKLALGKSSSQAVALASAKANANAAHLAM
ncbi:transglycosylase SLT domain-containing protein [Dyella choica]|uniref:Transglycosylase SLT domain-containing protein n=1 Tax=Dyella choica TaxID=1927959 RepID=A0A3S0R4J0_9GAMM|nr:transglycosylase SLT domain-containing protein [Dyella choica]RUL76800.1 hypothetical protein EKH80_08825 [Dyella choica]